MEPSGPHPPGGGTVWPRRPLGGGAGGRCARRRCRRRQRPSRPAHTHPTPPDRVRHGGSEAGVGGRGPQGAAVGGQGGRAGPASTPRGPPARSHATRPPHLPQSSKHVVLAALKRAPSELASHQPKAWVGGAAWAGRARACTTTGPHARPPSGSQVFKVDDHLGVAVSGLISDGRSLLRSMRAQCASHRFVYEAPLPPGRLVRAMADRAQARNGGLGLGGAGGRGGRRSACPWPAPVPPTTTVLHPAQVCTQRSWKRPLGVGLLVAGHQARREAGRARREATARPCLVPSLHLFPTPPQAKAGPTLHYLCPSGNCYDYKARDEGQNQ